MNSGQAQSNPLRDGIVTRTVPQPCTVVIFGATGDLTHRKLIPALYNLAADGDLPPELAVVGFARRPKTDEEFRNGARGGREEIFPPDGARRFVEGFREFASSIIRANSTMPMVTSDWRNGLQKIEQERETGGNRLFYLAVAPDQFETILKNLAAAD